MPEIVEQKIQEVFIAKGWTLSVAESCTGGALSARLVRLPGCSQYFLGSVVSYSNELKVNILGVDEQVLEAYGAVSREVVEQMANGIGNLTGSDYSLAISGIAGPAGGTEQKPVGTIWAAIAGKGEEAHVWTFKLDGQREEIIKRSVEIVLDEFWSWIR